MDWATAGSKPTKYFFSLEKTKYARRTITRLSDENDIIYTSTENLQQKLYEFYTNLYTSIECSEEAIDEFFKDLQGPTLTKQQSDDLEQPLTQTELANALFQMKNNKTPGMDGLPAEFYKTFWNKLSQPMLKMTHEVLNTGFPIDMLRSIFALMGKKDRNPLDLNNWRPISLLNCDYKIIAKALVNRINKVLTFIIDKDQKGFVKGRYIGENILELLGLIDHCDKMKYQPSC